MAAPPERRRFNPFKVEDLKPSKRAQKMLREKLRADRPLIHERQPCVSETECAFYWRSARPVTPLPEDHTGILPGTSPFGVSFFVREQLALVRGSAFVEVFQNSGILNADDIVYLAHLCNRSHIDRVLLRSAVGLDSWDRNWDILKTFVRDMGRNPPTPIEAALGQVRYHRRKEIWRGLEERRQEELLLKESWKERVLTDALILTHMSKLCGCTNDCECDDEMYEYLHS
ncbi:hypothetical protein BDZ89DRAFT_1139733 [Hymenopellis radicata]|nr:hypothetical protein BDZ89DRAFT_1139733 [Hymenopellis radicata]